MLNALVIDDEHIVLDSIASILRGENFSVDLSRDGRQGLDRALRRNYDVVLTDIRMPEMDGLHVLKRIKQTKPHVPVVVITGYGSVDSAVDAMKSGAANYLEKPFTPRQIIDAVVQAVGLRKDHPFCADPIVHPYEVERVLTQAANDHEKARSLLQDGSKALPERLTTAERCAILSGDIAWLEQRLGTLTGEERSVLESRLSAEIW
ncbi:Response regulator receiver domain-containing protein [Desulfacinum hydrothermale DSM 13146]|uniref:Response regulator receiver domain-containing protein n=1 Tax=Desulfacinum hydrothermale DSM 13146 TaxID=1121390 RepID=A0A1W1X9F1_9BACT|nr:response regulator [Desulfacinum hydrothermale]SMC20519.1 Response regulator receiver domain-containing protein [Desulfacinum hydrothermale DSM 13146]